MTSFIKSAVKTKSRSFIFASLAVVAAVWAAPNAALANPLTWNVNGTFADGATLAGSFTYDSDTDAMSAWNLSVAGGNTGLFPNFVYSNTSGGTFLDLFHTDNSFIFCITGGCSNTRQLRLFVDSPLTNAGGSRTLPAGPAGPTPPTYNVECNNCSPFRFLTSGTAVSVPEPATLALFGTVLGGLAFVRRRRKT